MKNGYLRAEYRAARANERSVPPTLELDISLFLSRTGAGHSFTLQDDVTGCHVTDVVGSLFWQGEGERRPLEGFVGFGHISPSTHLSEIREGGEPLECTLWFPLSPSTIARIEELRHGSKARFYLETRVSGFYREPLTAFNPPRVNKAERGHPVAIEELAGYAVPRESIVPFHVSRLIMQTSRGSEQWVEIEKSQWVEEILPRLGHGTWRIVEVPLANLQEDLGGVEPLLIEAERKFGLGDWAASLTASRRAVEAMKPHFERFISPVHTQAKGPPAAAKAGDLNDAFEEWAKSTMGLSEKTRALLHAGAHALPDGATLERADAELGLMFAAALRRYIGLRMLK